MKIAKTQLRQIIKEELGTVMEGSEAYISPDIQSAIEKKKRIRNHPNPKIRELASDKNPDGTQKPYKKAREEYNMAVSLADGLGEIIKEELKGVLGESYTSTQIELSDIDREMEAMLSQPGGALDQAILAKVDAAGAKYLKMNDRQTTPAPMSNMADADLRVLHLYTRRVKDGKSVNTVSPEDATLAYQQFTEIDREINKRGLSY